MSITHIFETHIHVDFVSGARELCARAESAKIYLRHEEGARHGFGHEKIVEGDHFKFGSVWGDHPIEKPVLLSHVGGMIGFRPGADRKP